MGHLFYIPFCLLLGLVFGWLWGGRSSVKEIERLRTRLDRAEANAAEQRLKGLKEAKESIPD